MEEEWNVLIARDDSNMTNTSQAYISLQLIGLVGCVVVFVTGFFAASSLRHLAWFSFMFSWVLSTISYLLLFMGGRMDDAPFSLCLVQSALVYAAPPLTSATTLAFVTEVFFSVRNHFATKERGHQLIWAILIGPYLLHATIFTETMIMGLQNDGTVHQDPQRVLCYLKDAVPSQTSSVAVSILMVPIVIIGAWICVLLVRNRRSDKFKKEIPSIAIRVVVFSAFSVIANAIANADSSSNGHPDHTSYIIISLIPVAAFLSFGTHSDILHVWMFWKRGSTRYRRSNLNPQVGTIEAHVWRV